MSAAYDGVQLDGAPIAVVDLSQPLYTGIPSSPNHPGFRHVLLRRHGDEVRDDGTSGANDLIIMGTHNGTHVDALAHVSHDGLLHGGVVAEEAQRGGRFSVLGAETLEPVVAPGFVLDLPAALGVDRLEPGQPVTADDLELARKLVPGDIPEGAALLLRTGWATLWDDPEAFRSHAGGVPGPDPSGARWLLGLAPRLVGSDTTAFEHIPPGRGHSRLPVHRLVLVERGIPIVEMLNLEDSTLRSSLRHTLVLSPLRIVGATGAPVRPLALVAHGAGEMPPGS